MSSPAPTSTLVIFALLEKTLYNMMSPVVWIEQRKVFARSLEKLSAAEILLYLGIQNEVKYILMNIEIIDFLKNLPSDLSSPTLIIELFNKGMDELTNKVVKKWIEVVKEKLALGDSAENVLLKEIKGIYDVISFNTTPLIKVDYALTSNPNFVTLLSAVKHKTIHEKIIEVVAPKLKAKQTTKEVMEIVVDLIDNTQMVNEILKEIQTRMIFLVEENDK
jgi:hypothetical protein